jgi:hypothetical protein
MNKEQRIQTLLDTLFENAKESSQNASWNIDKTVNYAYVTGYYESSFSNLLKSMNLTKAQMDILSQRCEIK